MKINIFRSALNLQRKPKAVTEWWPRDPGAITGIENYEQVLNLHRDRRQRQQLGLGYFRRQLKTSFLFVAAVIFIVMVIKLIEKIHMRVSK